MKEPPAFDPIMRDARGGEQIEEAAVATWERERPPLELRLEAGKLVATPAPATTDAPP